MDVVTRFLALKETPGTPEKALFRSPGAGEFALRGLVGFESRQVFQPARGEPETGPESGQDALDDEADGEEEVEHEQETPEIARVDAARLRMRKDDLVTTI